MLKRLGLVVLVAMGCAKREEPRVEVSAAPPPPAAPAAPATKADSVGAQLQVPLGGNEDAAPSLPFRIVKNWKDGTWVWFEAETDGPDPARFTFGMDDVAPKGEIPVAFAKAQFSVADRAQGGRLLAKLAAALKQAVPAPRAERPLEPLKMTVAVLGRGTTRLPGGGFQGIGNWTATKAFPQQEGREGEVFFNFSTGAGKGEFSQKDADYDKDVVAVFASLRDGPPPPSKKK
jgi:hypothetical protein